MRSVGRAAAIVLAAATLAVGCSDEGSKNEGAAPSPAGKTDTTPPPTTDATATRPEPPPDQSRWAAQVDDACKPWQEQIDAVPPPVDAGGLERWLAETLPLVRKQVAAVAAVKPPAKQSEAKRAALFVGGMRKLERGLTRYLAAIRADDAEAVQQALAEANAAGAETRAYAVSVDITQCGGYEGG